MPVYLLHGFRWPRPLIRIHIILQNLDDAAAEWLVAPGTTETMLENFHETFPDTMKHLPNLRFVEQYDPNDMSSLSQPYAYVADIVEEVKLGLDVDEVRGKEVSDEQTKALAAVRDKLAPEVPVGWYVVVCGDEERLATGNEDEAEGEAVEDGQVEDQDVREEETARVSSVVTTKSIGVANGASDNAERTSKASTTADEKKEASTVQASTVQASTVQASTVEPEPKGLRKFFRRKSRATLQNGGSTPPGGVHGREGSLLQVNIPDCKSLQVEMPEMSESISELSTRPPSRAAEWQLAGPTPAAKTTTTSQDQSPQTNNASQGQSPETNNASQAQVPQTNHASQGQNPQIKSPTEPKPGRTSMQRLMNRRSAPRKSSPLAQSPIKRPKTPTDTAQGPLKEQKTLGKSESFVEVIALNPITATPASQLIHNYNTSATLSPRPTSFSQPRSSFSQPRSSFSQPRSSFSQPRSSTSTPPVSSTFLPPRSSTSTPPVSSTFPPPRSSTSTPPVGSSLSPPHSRTSTPPVGSSLSPPHSRTSTPPASSNLSPPRSSTSTPTVSSRNEQPQYQAYRAHSGTSTPTSAIAGPIVYQPYGKIVDTEAGPSSETGTSPSEHQYRAFSPFQKTRQYSGREVQSFDMVAHSIENAIQAMR
ncbi:hypothetical protein TI39_contig5859g00007 [Zymoseptoria brevis]|uniref:Uncharacterized protein n=1 Tax=Zymoseptoria brevis TaxID=1047168 RepID=A0A0F4G7Z1_9PEZI|nr:hypothetical protein TI39_contig5859g00007 [Zymoseptoria brevis]